MSGMKFGSKEKCHKCGKTVYLMEKVTVEGKATQIFHNYCFRCSACNKVVTLANYVSLDDQIFCKTHYLAELHARKTKAQNAAPVNKQTDEEEEQNQQQEQQQQQDEEENHQQDGEEEEDQNGGSEQQQQQQQNENGDGYSDEDYNDDEY